MQRDPSESCEQAPWGRFVEIGRYQRAPVLLRFHTASLTVYRANNCLPETILV
jgi:hypothetical protein